MGKGGKNPGLQSEEGGQFGLGPDNAERMVGPIVGVHSTSCDEAIKIYEGHTTYCEWRFIFREKPQQGGRRGRRPGQPPVGWHPGDTLDEQGNKVPGGTGPNQPPRGRTPRGNQPPPPIQTPRYP